MNRTLLLASVVFLATACNSSDDGPCDPNAPNTICTIAGNGTSAFRGDDEPATQASLSNPMDVAIAPTGEVWILDFNNYVIRAIDDSGDIRTVVGSGRLGDSPPDGVASVPALEADGNHIADLTFHDGYLYLAAFHGSRIKRVNLATMELENYAGLGVRTRYSGDGMDAFQAAVDLPSSIAVDPTGNIVFMDQENQVIRMVDQDHVIHRVAGSCVIEDPTECAAGQQPVACPGSNKLTCGDPATTCSYGVCAGAYSGDGGDALALRMGQPYGALAEPAGQLAYDGAGNLYFADTDNNRIRKIDTHGIVSTVAGTGAPGFSGDGGPATDAMLNHPVDLATADDGTIYFTDVENNCVRRIEPTGVIDAVAGQCNADPALPAFSGDGGPPLEATLNRPYGIDLVGKKLYISDTNNQRIRVVNLR